MEQGIEQKSRDIASQLKRLGKRIPFRVAFSPAGLWLLPGSFLAFGKYPVPPGARNI